MATAETSNNVDPNTGRALKDRFHQIRGEKFNERVTPNIASRLATEFLQSRGAPITPQNLVIANEYLSGGGLAKLEQQQETENDIADAAIAAEGGVGNGAPAVPSGALPGSVSNDTPLGTPSPALPMDVPSNDVVPAGGTPSDAADVRNSWITPALLAGMGISGAVGLGAAGMGLAARRRRLAGEADVDARSAASAVDNIAPPLALPPPTSEAPQAAAPQPNPYAAQTGKTQPVDTVGERNSVGNTSNPDTAPIATEDVMPQQTETSTAKARPVSTGSVTRPDGSTFEYTVYKDGDMFMGTDAEGNVVKDRTLSAVRKALRGL